MRHNSAATAGLGNSRQPPYMMRCWSWSGDTAAIPELPGLFRMISPNVYVNVFRPASHFTCQLLHTLPAALRCSTWRTSDKCLYTVICFGIMIWTSLKRKYYGTCTSLRPCICYAWPTFKLDWLHRGGAGSAWKLIHGIPCHANCPYFRIYAYMYACMCCVLEMKLCGLS